MSRVPDPKLRLPLMLEHVLLLLTGPEWRRGFTSWMGMVRTHRLGGSAPCFCRSFRLPPSEERLALAEACASAISVLRSHIRTFSSLDGATTFSSHVSRAVGPANLPSVQSTAVHFNGNERRPSKDSAVLCFQDRTSMQTRPFAPSCVRPRLPLCLRSGHIAHSHWSKLLNPSSYLGETARCETALRKSNITSGQVLQAFSCCVQYSLVLEAAHD